GAPDLGAPERRWIGRAVAALRAHPGRALLTVGPWQAAETQALGLVINERIGALGATLRFSEPVAASGGGPRSAEALAGDMAAGRVTALAVIGTNPAYAMPADAGFRAAMERVPFRLHAGLHYDETASLCEWHAPL